jgi:hypothetical protein
LYTLKWFDRYGFIYKAGYILFREGSEQDDVRFFVGGEEGSSGLVDAKRKNEIRIGTPAATSKA